MASNKKSNIEPFDSSDFHTWQTQVKYALMSKGLWPLVNGTRQLTDSVDDLEEDERAQSIIALHLQKHLIHHVSNLSKAKEMWVNLDKLFGAQSLHSEISLKFQLYDLELKSRQTISSLVSELKGLMGQLASIKEIVKDKDATAVLLKAMPKTDEWKPLITQLRFHTDATLEQTISTLLEEEKNKGGPSSSKPSSSQAFFSQQEGTKVFILSQEGAHC